MASIPGSVPLSGKVAPTDTTDTFATHVDIFGEGGYMTVADQAERDAITTERRKQGMAVFVNDTNEMYILQDGVTNADWVLFSGGGGDLQSVMNAGSSATGLTTQVDIETDDFMFLTSGQAITLTTDDFNMSVAGSTFPMVGDELQVTNVFTFSGNTYGKLKWRQGVQSVKVTLTAADILNLHNTPVDLIPAPGSGKIINFINLISYYDFNTTPYTITNNQSAIQLKFAGATSVSISLIAQTEMLESTSDQYGAVNNWPGFPFQLNTSTVVPNAALQASIPAASPVTLGDSPIHVYLQYMIITL